MSGKEQIFEFLYIIIFLIIIGFSVFYFTIPGNFENFRRFLQAMAPVIAFVGIMSLRLRGTVNEVKERKDDGHEGITLYLSYFDKFKYEIILLSLPSIFIMVSLLIDQISGWQFIQSGLWFVVNLLILRDLFSKR
jgi:hypothetical protein